MPIERKSPSLICPLVARAYYPKLLSLTSSNDETGGTKWYKLRILLIVPHRNVICPPMVTKPKFSRVYPLILVGLPPKFAVPNYLILRQIYLSKTSLLHNQITHIYIIASLSPPLKWFHKTSEDVIESISSSQRPIKLLF